MDTTLGGVVKVNRCRCLRCGKLKRGKKTRYICTCGGEMVPVSGNMLPLAQQLSKMGFELARAEDFISAIDAVSTIEIGMLNLEFARVYDKMVFFTSPNALQDDFLYNVFQSHGSDPFCRLTHQDENYLALGRDISSKRAMKLTIHSVVMWASELESSGAASIYRLAGLI